MQHKTDNKPYLSSTEWAAVTLFAGALLFFILFSHLATTPPLTPLADLPIQVTISGEVEYPGTYTLPAGTTVAGVNSVVFPFPGATAKKRAITSPLKEGEHLVFVDSRISVTLRGAVTYPTTLKVPRGSFLQDFLSEIPFSRDADIESIAGKRVTRQGQVIIVRTKSLP